MLQPRGRANLLSQSSLWRESPTPKSPRPQHVHQGNSLQKTYLAFASSASEARRNFKLGSSKARFGGFATSARCLSLGLRACQSTLQLYVGPLIGGKRAHCLQKPSIGVMGKQLTSAGLLCFGNSGHLIPAKRCWQDPSGKLVELVWVVQGLRLAGGTCVMSHFSSLVLS